MADAIFWSLVMSLVVVMSYFLLLEFYRDIRGNVRIWLRSWKLPRQTHKQGTRHRRQR